MRVRDFQQILGKFTDNQKGTIISDCPIYIETMDGRLEEIRKIELQERVKQAAKEAGIDVNDTSIETEKYLVQSVIDDANFALIENIISNSKLGHPLLCQKATHFHFLIYLIIPL